MKCNVSKSRFHPIFASLFVLVLAGCARTKDPVDMKEADRDDAVLIAITRDGKIHVGGNEAQASEDFHNKRFNARTEIRVRNASRVDLKDVVIDGETFGDIKRDGMTEYRTSEFVHRYASASLSADSRPLGNQPIVYGFETALGLADSHSCLRFKTAVCTSTLKTTKTDELV